MELDSPGRALSSYRPGQMRDDGRAGTDVGKLDGLCQDYFLTRREGIKKG